LSNRSSLTSGSDGYSGDMPALLTSTDRTELGLDPLDQGVALVPPPDVAADGRRAVPWPP
jgi:hypothetical protein